MTWDSSSISPPTTASRSSRTAAQAHGARWGGQPVGGFGIGSFSLYATKNVTSGEGGLVTTNDGDVAHRLRILRNQGMRGQYEFESVGTNARMTDLQAAIAIPQIRQLDQINAQRRSNAARLAEGLADLPGILCPPRFDDPGHVMHQFTIRITGDAPISRAPAERLGAAGISTGVYYPRPAFDYEVYRNHPRVLVDSCPHAEQLSSEVLSLPVHPGLTDSDLDRIVRVAYRCIGGEGIMTHPDPLRVIVFGAGVMGAHHVRVLRRDPDVELVAVVDPDGDRADALADGTGALGMTSWNGENVGPRQWSRHPPQPISTLRCHC